MIGAGNVGSALASSLSKAGHSVTITATTREKAERVAQETGAQAAGSNREAVEAAEVVILAIPNDAVDAVVGELDGALDGKVVVDTANRVNPGDPGSTLDGSSVAERIKERVPDAHVAKAFNTVFAAHMADPTLALEGMALINIYVNMRNGWSWQTEWKLAGPTE